MSRQRARTGVRRLILSMTWAAALGFPHALRAQHGGRLAGTVTDSLGVPLAGVEVTIIEGERRARTDSAGRFVFAVLDAGVYHVSLRRIDYRPITGTVHIADGDSIDLRLRMGLVASRLDTVHVRARTHIDMLDAFEQRRATGVGVFIARETLRSLDAWTLPDIIVARTTRVQAVRLIAGGYAVASTRPSTSMSRNCPSAPICYMSVWLDGQQVYDPDRGDPPYDLSGMRAEDVEGVEIYRSPAETPTEFTGTGASCGVIVIWSRDPNRRP